MTLLQMSTHWQSFVVEAQAGNTAVLYVVALEKAIVTFRLANWRPFRILFTSISRAEHAA